MSHGRRRRISRAKPTPWSTARENPFLRKIWRSTRDRWQRFALVGFLLWATYSLLLSPQGWIQLLRLRGSAGELRAEICALETERDSLDRLLAELNGSDTFLLERRAREEFGFLRANERLYVLPYDPEDERCIGEAETGAGDRFSDRLPGPPPGSIMNGGEDR